MMVAPGTPAITLAPFVAPAFNNPSIANGGVIAPIIVENEASTASVNHPFTIGHVFAQGQLKMSDSLVGKVAGQADIALQFDPKATWPDGSVRHGVISGIVPTIAANALLTVNLTRSTAARDNTPVSAATITATGANPIATVEVSGITYTADVDAALTAGTGVKLWLAGPVCTEYLLDLTFKTAQGAAHPALTLQCAIRYYPASGRVKIDLTHENGNYCHTAEAPGAITIAAVIHNTTISIGGQVVRTQNDLLHRPGARWYKSYWFGGEPALHVRFNLQYLSDTRMVPNYDRSLTISPATIASAYPSQFASIEPMSAGMYSGYMPTSGGRPDLGIHPRWIADYLLSQSSYLKKVVIAGSASGGAWEVHARSRNPGVAYGQIIDVVHYPYLTYMARYDDANNPQTDQNESYPIDQSTQQGFSVDTSHMPNFSAMAYMLTGDYFHLEELIFWASYPSWTMHPQYRGLTDGLVSPHPPRGQAWSLRTLAFGAALMPDDHFGKEVYMHFLNKNMEYYNAQYSDNPSANALGVIVNGQMFDGYGVGRLAPWQDDYFTLITGVVADLGFTEANRLLQWKAKFPIGRLIGQGYCWREAAPYQMLAKDTENGPIYSSFAELYQKNYSDMPACPATGDVGEATVPFGYAAILESTLAYAVDRSAPGAQAAYTRLMTRVSHPNYAEQGPQYAIVPRAIQATEGSLPPESLTIIGGPFASTPFASGFLASASQEPPQATVTGVTISPSVATGSTTFSATVEGANGQSPEVTWEATAGSIEGGVFTAPAAASDAQVIIVTARSVQDTNYAGIAVVTIAALPRVSPPAFVSSRKGRGRSRARR